MATSLEPAERRETAVSLKPEDIFVNNRPLLVDSLDLKKTTLGEQLVKNGLLSRTQHTCIMVSQ